MADITFCSELPHHVQNYPCSELPYPTLGISQSETTFQPKQVKVKLQSMKRIFEELSSPLHTAKVQSRESNSFRLGGAVTTLGYQFIVLK